AYRRHRQRLQRDRRGQARRPARAGLLHGRHDRRSRREGKDDEGGVGRKMALPTKLTLEIVTPDRALVTEQVDEVELPGADGYFGVLPGHTPLLASLHVGELWYRTGQEKH